MTGTRRYHATCRETCRICGGGDLEPYLVLGAQPPSNAFLDSAEIEDEEAFPLDVYLCRACGLSQLNHVVSAADIFDDYVYLSSTSQALCHHYQSLVDGALAAYALPDQALVVDIGCNDGIMLKAYPTDRYRLLGVEPSSAGAFAEKAGFDVVDEFFDAGLGSRLRHSHGPAALITATNVFAHVDDIAGFAEGIAALLDANGVCVLEFPYLGDMLTHGYFDTIYHEHLSYLALTPLVRLFDDVGLRALDYERTEIGASGPAIRLSVCRVDSPRRSSDAIQTLLDEETAWEVCGRPAYDAFAAHVEELRDRIAGMVRDVIDSGHRVGAFGAPAKGNTLLNSLGLTAADVVAVAENNALKVGKLTPGSHIPIVDDPTFLSAGISHALLLSWNYADFFLAKAKFVKRGGKFIIPLPDPCIRP